MHGTSRKIGTEWMMFERYQPDLEAYVGTGKDRTLFVAPLWRRTPVPDRHIIYEDEGAIAFLAMNPTQYGYTLVAPKEHKEQLAGDFSLEEYLGLRGSSAGWPRRCARRWGPSGCYILSLGSDPGNAHVHWHVVPLPPGTP